MRLERRKPLRKPGVLGELDPRLDVEQLAFELTAALELANYLTLLHGDAELLTRGRRAVDRLLASASARS